LLPSTDCKLGENARDMALENIVLLGDARLRKLSRRVTVSEPAVSDAGETLKETLRLFRARHGFGRAIASPQIGANLRLLACHLERGPLAQGKTFLMLNPEIIWHSQETFTLWDDCLSFPDLLVRVRRHSSISVRYTSETGETVVAEHLDAATAELLQHEIDHLDGRLAVDLALDRESLVSRQVFEADPERFAEKVDGINETPE